VIVALDGGLVAERALPFAQTLAKRWQTPLCLLHVRNPVDESFGRNVCLIDDSKTLTIHSRSGAYLTGLAESLRTATDLSVDYRTISGVSNTDTLRAVCESNARALVLVRSQRTALSRFFSGSVSDNLIGRLPIPLLVVPASQQSGLRASLNVEKQLFKRLLAYLDGSDVVAKLLEYTVATAPDGAVCELLRVLPIASLFATGYGGYSPSPDLRNDAWVELLKAKHILQRQGLRCKSQLVYDGQSAASAIVDRAQATQADSHGRPSTPFTLVVAKRSR
jgi:nucleotide-binding universal stress UspA family protein